MPNNLGHAIPIYPDNMIYGGDLGVLLVGEENGRGKELESE
jgi:hypothetical protein